MTLNLDRDLVFIDVETTGLNVIRDRIVQIGMLKIHRNGSPNAELEMLINPGIPISEEAMAVHGIMPSDLANKPTFQQVAQKIRDFIGDADLAGYNHARFDVPMLMEEFDRTGIDFDLNRRRLVDVQRIFYKMEPRTLRAAHRLYVGSEMTDAHDALADVRATLAVFEGQLARYDGVDMVGEDGEVVAAPVRNDIQALHDFTNDLHFIDVTQKLRRQPDGTVVFTFGKYANQKLDDVWRQERGYFNWILDKEFSVQVKAFIRDYIKSKK